LASRIGAWTKFFYPTVSLPHTASHEKSYYTVLQAENGREALDLFN